MIFLFCSGCMYLSAAHSHYTGNILKLVLAQFVWMNKGLAFYSLQRATKKQLATCALHVQRESPIDAKGEQQKDKNRQA